MRDPKGADTEATGTEEVKDEGNSAQVVDTEEAVPAAHSLKEVFDGDFLVGAAISHDQVTSDDSRLLSLIKSQFNSATPENCMKWQIAHPKPGVFDFEQADAFVAFAERNDMHIVGHVLVDQEMVPDWVFQDATGGPVDRDTLEERLREYIHAIVGRYKGRVDAWQVVNEPIGRDGEFVDSKWYRVFGEDYVSMAFRLAHEADPNAELYYNGHDLLTQAATDRIVRLVKDIKEQGGRIDGIGVQAHWKLEEPSLNEIERGIVGLSAAGVKIMITELDISLLPRCRLGDDVESGGLNPYANGLPREQQTRLASRYGELFALFRKHSDTVARVNFWGVHDGQSWLNYWPCKDRRDYPLLFDRDLQPKPAFYTVVGATADRTGDRASR